MDKEERKLGTPYLQDMEIVSWLTKYRSCLFLKLDAISANQWICNVYEYISSYRREIEHDAKALFSIFKEKLANSDCYLEAEYNKEDVLAKYAYIKEISPKFAADYKKGRQELIKLYHEIIDFRDYNSDEESYYKAIEELYKIISVHDMWIRKKNSDYFDQRRKQQNEAKETKSENNVITESDLNEIPSKKYKTLVKYFSPKENFNALDKEEKIKVLNYITCAPTKKGRGGITRDLIETLRNYFKENPCFLRNEFGKVRKKDNQAEILSEIFCNSTKTNILKYI